ncbi:MAG: DNA-formamidopyrimidine glycosylase [Leifsonia sp.]|nr:DNA-formamidopyrimidine glycosylase [Leifsonia sp.]|tara:strand:- start:74096 stop:74986 length:891 start_codon:yes stop_codon:yes gene_type:complete
MPELPEVEVVRLGLAPAVTASLVRAVTVLDERSLRRHEGPSEDFVDRVTGALLNAPERRGKFLWIPLAGERADEAVVVHLGMSGQVLLRSPDAPRDRLTRIVLDLEHPEHGPLRVDFVDQRIFGSMALDGLVPTRDRPEQRIPSQVVHIARDPLDPDFSERAFFAALARKRTTIKRALLDQTLVSGIGNIYADEALWAARIHYDQPTETLSRPRARRLLDEVRAVLGKALAEGGTSFDAQYVNVNGASGYFSHSLNAYGRHGEPCPRCGRPIVREVFMNRGSHFCPSCQRLRAVRG